MEKKSLIKLSQIHALKFHAKAVVNRITTHLTKMPFVRLSRRTRSCQTSLLKLWPGNNSWRTKGMLLLWSWLMPTMPLRTPWLALMLQTPPSTNSEPKWNVVSVRRMMKSTTSGNSSTYAFTFKLYFIFLFNSDKNFVNLVSNPAMKIILH